MPGEAQGIGDAALVFAAGEHRGARRGVDDPAPGMAETYIAQRREGLLKLFGQALEALRALGKSFVAAPAEMVDGVVAGPENAVVGGLAQVVKLIAGIGDAIASGAADGL
ncbi:hypothetical protein D3C80_1642550 [compost metagenome]